MLTVGNIIIYKTWHWQRVYAKVVEVNKQNVLVQTGSGNYVMLLNDEDSFKVIRHKEEHPILEISEVIKGLTLGTLNDKDGANIVTYCAQSTCGDKEYEFIRDLLYKRYEEFFKDAVFD